MFYTVLISSSSELEFSPLRTGVNVGAKRAIMNYIHGMGIIAVRRKARVCSRMDKVSMISVGWCLI